MPLYPWSPAGKRMRLAARGLFPSRHQIGRLHLSAEQAATNSTTGVRTAVTDNGSTQVLTSGLNNPPYARNITATAGGTAGDIKAIQVVVEGTNLADEPITETLPAFTVDTPGTVVGNKAFKTVTKVTIPAHDGTGATTAIGFGNKLGLPGKFDLNPVIHAYHNGSREGTAPTVVVDGDELEKNTATLNTALNGSPVVIDFIA